MRVFFSLLLLSLLMTGCTTLQSPDTPFPNSYTITSGATEIVFTDLPANCTIAVFNLNGDLIRRVEITSGNGQYAWDLKNESGETVKSGIYTYQLASSSENKTGKIVINR